MFFLTSDGLYMIIAGEHNKIIEEGLEQIVYVDDVKLVCSCVSVRDNLEA